MNIIRLEQINDKIIAVRNNQVILDNDVAELYGVATKEVNQAVKNNPEKFPKGYVITPSASEWQKLKIEIFNSNYLRYSVSDDLRSKILTAKFSKMRVSPKGPQAVQTTIAIIEAFAKLRELTRSLQFVQETTDNSEQRNLLQQSGQLFSELLNDNLELYDTETTLELNLALLRLKRTVKKKRP